MERKSERESQIGGRTERIQFTLVGKFASYHDNGSGDVGSTYASLRFYSLVVVAQKQADTEQDWLDSMESRG